MQKLWKRYGGYVIAAAVLVVGIVAGMQGWTAWQASVRADEAERYYAAVRGQGVDRPALDVLAQEGRTGYADLAALQAANALVEAGDEAGAVAAYDALSADGGAPQPMRDLATVLAALHAMDTESAGAVRGRLAPLDTEAGPWRFMARELLAVLALREGDTAAARTAFADLKEAREAPPGVRSRAAEMLSMLGGPAPGEGDGAAPEAEG
nr:tetratricopeptide repeat protein [Roseospira goensis]